MRLKNFIIPISDEEKEAQVSQAAFTRLVIQLLNGRARN